MNNKYKIIALFGKSGAGKDTIQKWMVENLPNTNNIISCTTRPPRDGEVDGVDYHFVDLPVFTQMVLNGKLIEATEFNGWFYGTSIDSLDINKINIGVFNITGIDCLLQNSQLDVLPILILARDKERLQRCLDREEMPDCTEICRRFLTDEKDFNTIDFNYNSYLNTNNNPYGYILNVCSVNEFIHGQE